MKNIFHLYPQANWYRLTACATCSAGRQAGINRSAGRQAGINRSAGCQAGINRSAGRQAGINGEGV